MHLQEKILDCVRRWCSLTQRKSLDETHPKYTHEQALDRLSERNTTCKKCSCHSITKANGICPTRTYSFPTNSAFRQKVKKSITYLGLFSTNLPAFLLLLCTLNVASARSVVKDECDPTNPFSCKYGATCQLEYGRHRKEGAYYRCTCPKISCFSSGLFDPVCGEDGRTQDTYFNVLCLMLKECELQRPIRQVCYGGCNDRSCKVLTPENMRHAPCPREDVALCMNGGLCVHHKLLNQSRCRCPSDYTGDRCQSKKLPEGSHHEQEEKNCDSSSELLTIFAIVLLSVVLLLIVVCMCWRCRKGKHEDDKLWPSTASERDETTPLRESTRTDYLFPGGSNKDSENN